MLNNEKIQEELKRNGFKLTSQRKAIIEVLMEHKDRFITAEEIHKKVLQKHPKTNFSTIYRNLESFEKINIIHKTNISDNASIYELVCNDNHHHHIICKKCGKTEIIDFCPLDNINNSLKSFKLIDHKFELYGLCDKCNNK
ncbi:Fur family transcriptional regulator [Sporosalibacterium faouarense]|uniref:Fur family transcriptional regulator n=1 Tax=Sporosalibacterium faouarense TaxID=516123 RepID=UPI00141D5038|nr:Fur family transcriptional regulator [Sporosalibacterium faouarense]MTI48682.1 transcriptional repressor [Bacillota bacterium]